MLNPDNKGCFFIWFCLYGLFKALLLVFFCLGNSKLTSFYRGHIMSSVGLNKWIVSGHLAADAEIKIVDLKSGEKAKVAKATIYVRKARSRDEAFTVSLSIWEGAAAWRKLSFLKKGSLIICTGSLEPNPYVSSTDNLPRAGLSMNVLDIDLDNIRNSEDEELTSEGDLQPAVAEQEVLPQPTNQKLGVEKVNGKESAKSQQTHATSGETKNVVISKETQQKQKASA